MKFISEKGSTVTISGKYNGIFTIDFDWFEEDACIEMYLQFNKDFDEPAIIASCECCEDSQMIIPLRLQNVEEVEG